MLIGTKSIFYFIMICYLVNFAFGLFSVWVSNPPSLNYTAQDSLYQCVDFYSSLRATTTWMLFTNAIAFVSLIAFL